MGLNADQLSAAMAMFAAADPRLEAVLARIGTPAPRQSPKGPEALLRAIIGQQVSVAAANSIWTRFEAACGGTTSDLAHLASRPAETLRAAGLSGQKVRYVQALAEAMLAGQLNLEALPQDDEAAISQLVAVPGIGRWTAEIYLLFAEGRPDVFPAGDLAVQIAMGHFLGEGARPSEAATRRMAQPFEPNRGALAILCWHHYNQLI